MDDYIAKFIFFFAVIDPIGTIPVFIAATTCFTAKIKVKIAFQAAAISALILLLFIIAGEIILNAIGIPLSVFQIAGGIVLFLFSLTMIFGDSKPDKEVESLYTCNATEIAIFPLSVPSLASPGAMLAAVLMTENNKYNFIEQLETTGIMLCVMLTAFILMASSSFLFRYIGTPGASIISRVMGLILSSVAVNNILEGIVIFFKI